LSFASEKSHNKQNHRVVGLKKPAHEEEGRAGYGGEKNKYIVKLY
jgi:hypothetical protein